MLDRLPAGAGYVSIHTNRRSASVRVTCCASSRLEGARDNNPT